MRGYEAEKLPMWLWESAILQGYAVFRILQATRNGAVITDMAQRRIWFESLLAPASPVNNHCDAYRLTGPLHGGANVAVLRMLQRIGSTDNIPDLVRGHQRRVDRDG